MTFLLLEIGLISIFSHIVQGLLDPSVLLDLALPPPGHIYLPFYLWISYRIFYFYIRREKDSRRLLFTIAYFYKLAFACLMTYLSVNVYAGGDLTGYYTLPYWISDRLVSLDWNNIQHIASLTGYYFRDAGLNSTTIISYGFAGIFVILPPSLFGLTVLAGTFVYIATVALYKLLEPHIEYRKTFFLMYFFAPSITLQLGYTGKESVILPLVTAVILLTARSSAVWLRGLLLAAIFYIRFYQSFFLILAWVGARFTIRQLFSIRGTPFIIAGFGACYVIYRKALEKIGEFGFSSLTDLASFMSMAYDKGNLVLKPLPFPLTYLQIFRPFPWESHNMMALVVSVEMVAFMCLTAYLLLFRRKILRQRFKLDPLFRFLALYVIIQVAVFSYNDNMGDLARRKIYFLPLLIGLLCYKRMSPEEISYAGTHGLRGAEKSPPPPSAPADNALPSPRG